MEIIIQNDIGHALPIISPFDKKPIEVDTKCHFHSECEQTKSYLCMEKNDGISVALWFLCKDCAKQYAPPRIGEEQYEIEGKLPNTNCGRPVKWIATSRSGAIIGFAKKPKVIHEHWNNPKWSTMYDSKVLNNVKPISGPWKKSLRKVVKK